MKAEGPTCIPRLQSMHAAPALTVDMAEEGGCSSEAVKHPLELISCMHLVH